MTPQPLLDLVPVLLAMLASIPIAVVDIRHRRIPDTVVLPAILAVVVARFLLGHGVVVILFDLLLGGSAFFVVRLLTRGMLGWGDVKYSALMCVAIGPWGWFVALALSCVAAGGWYGWLAVRGRALEAIPFAPFLVIGLAGGAVVAQMLPFATVLRYV
ncbi:MAG: prepilin peptidase [Spirochaetota bacterium]